MPADDRENFCGRWGRQKRYLVIAWHAVVVIAFVGSLWFLPLSRGQQAPGPIGRSYPYPADALAVISVKGIQPLQQRWEEWLQGMDPQRAPQWSKQWLADWHNWWQQREVRALRLEERLFLVLHDFAEDFDHPHWSLLLPVHDYQQFGQSFLTAAERRSRSREAAGIDAIRTPALGEKEQTVYLTAVEGYAVICSDRDVAECYRQDYRRGSTAAMGSVAGGAFVDADVALYINTAQVVKRYSMHLRALKGLVEFLWRQKNQELPGIDAVTQELGQKVLRGLIQAVEDSNGLVVAVGFGNRGVDVQLHMRFQDNTTSLQALRQWRNRAPIDWKHMPAGMPMYYSASTQGALGELCTLQLMSFTASDTNPQEQRLVSQHLEDLRAAGLEAIVVAEGFADRSLTIWRYRQPQQAARAWVKLHKVVGPGAQVQQRRLKTAPRVREAAEQYRGFSFTEVRLHYDTEIQDEDLKELPPAEREEVQRLLQRLLPERQTLWIGLIEKDGRTEVVHLKGRDWSSAQALLDAYCNGKKTLDSLPEFAQWRPLLAHHDFAYLIDLESARPILHGVLTLLAFSQEPPLPPIKLAPWTMRPWLILTSHSQDEVFSLRCRLNPSACLMLINIVEQLSKHID
jgi:hypothetical protein